MGNHGSIGAALKNVLQGVISLVTTGSIHVKNAADEARSVDLVLGEAEEELEIDAQRTLGHVDDALTHYNKLKNDTDREEDGYNHWMGLAKKAAGKAKGFPEGSIERSDWEKRAKQALDEAKRKKDTLAIYKQALDESHEDYEEALNAIEKVKMSKDKATSTREQLAVTNATLETKRNLAAANRSGDTNKSAALLKEATDKIAQMKAEVEADEMIAQRMPTSSFNLEAEIESQFSDDWAEKEFAKMMK